MTKKIIFIIVAVLVLAWAVQSFTPFKPFDDLKNFISGLFVPAVPSPEKQLNVFIRDNNFLPNASAMKVGANVTWYNEDTKNHTVTGEGWSSGELGPGKKFSKKFEQPGTYKYRCEIHPEMTGEIIVQ